MHGNFLGGCSYFGGVTLVAHLVFACSPASAPQAPRAQTVAATQPTKRANAKPNCHRPPPPPAIANGQRPAMPFARTVRVVFEKFDQNRDGHLDRSERTLAREAIRKEKSSAPNQGWPPRGPALASGARPNGPFSNRPQPVAGPKLTLGDITQLPPNTPLYAPATLRTLWLEFEDSDWEDEMADFYDSDIELSARLVVDGKQYEDVGVSFRGMSSFAMVPKGFKRSLNLSLDAWNEGQRLLGYRSLNLLNSAGDPTFLRAVLALEIARHYMPAPKANHVRVVINGEDWGLFVNAQQFNKDFIKEWFGTSGGRRWKVPGSPGGQGSLAYLGEEPKAYSEIYQLKGPADPEAYADLIRLCRVLDKTTPDQLETELAPLLDIDHALRYLALDNLLINSDGYFLRTSDYELYQDKGGRFVIIPHDVNETFNALEAGPGAADDVGVELDPLYAADDLKKPLISKLLSVPKWRAQYLGYLREMAEQWLDWERWAPIVEGYRASIQTEVLRDTRKLGRVEDFPRAITEDTTRQGPCGDEKSYGLKTFITARRAYLLNHSALQALGGR